MTIDLYHFLESGPCRTVRMVAAAIGVDLNLKACDLFKGEQNSPEFLKMNPQHVVPTLDDNGFYLAESRVISTYLIEKYAKDDSLYPKDPQQRALVNQRLYFDSSNLFQPFYDYYLMPLYRDAKEDKTDLEKLDKGLEFLDIYLEGQDYVAGKHLTVADIAIACTIANFPIFDYDITKYKNVIKWFNKVTTEIPMYKEINGTGLEAYKKLIANIRSSKK